MSRDDSSPPVPPPPSAPLQPRSTPDDPAVLPVPTWRAIEAVPLFLVSLVGTFVLSAAALLAPSCGGQFVLGALAGEVALGASVLGWVRYVSKAPLGALGMPRTPLRDVGAGLITGVGLVFLAGLAVVIVDTLVSTAVGHPVSQPDQVEPCVRGAWLVASAPVIILAAPLGEELFFRGFLYRGLRRQFAQWPASIISALVFGFVHYQGVSFLLLIPGLIVVGLGLALLFERRQSLVATIAAHAAFNVVGFAMIAAGR